MGKGFAKAQKGFKVIDPLAGGLIFGSGKAPPKPNPTYFGGSEEAANAYRGRFSNTARSGAAITNDAVSRLGTVTNAARNDLAGRSSDADTLQRRGIAGADRAGSGFDSSMSDYRAGRDATLGNASALESFGANAAQEYKQTADKQFAANQDRNQRSALAMAAGRGAAGLRTALASSTQANTEAANQAEITRAQQFNDMNQQRQNALVNAANIRAGVGSQDQGSAGQYSGRQLQYENNAQSGLQLGLNADVQRGQLGQNAAQIQGSFGGQREGLGTTAEVGVNTAQLAADQKNEEARVNAEVQARKNKGLFGKIFG